MEAFIFCNIFLNKIDRQILSYFLIAILTGFFKPQLSFECSFILIPSKWIAFSKILLNEFETLDLSETISSFSTYDIFGKVVTLSDKIGSKVFQDFLLSVALFKSSLS